METNQATEKQVALIRSLREERVLSAQQVAYLDKALPTGLTKNAASRVISGLFAAPRKEATAPATNGGGSTLPDVPEGRYAIDEQGAVKFYEVDRPTEGKWAGRVFVSVRASDERWPIKNLDAKRVILAAIAADPKAAAVRFGHLLGECAICGKSLTDENSRAAGIGPVCAKKRGWN